MLLLAIGASGSALVFDHRIDEWLNPKLLLAASGGGQPIGLDALHAAVRAAVPQALPGAFIRLPRRPDGVVQFDVDLPARGPRGTAEEWQVMVDPVSAVVQGSRRADTHLMALIYDFHWRLLSGATGACIVGWLGVVLLAIVASGLYLWWPRSGRFRIGLVFKRGGRGIRRWFDLHRVVGAYGAVPFTIIAFSGVYMIFPHYVEPVVLGLSPSVMRRSAEPRSQPVAATEPIGIDAAVTVARALWPHAELKYVALPATADGVIQVTLRQPGEVRRSGGATRVYVDQYSGAVRGVRDPGRASAGDTFLAWQFPLHNGEAGGLPGRWLVVAAGCAPLALVLSGAVIWWRKRRARHAPQRPRARLPRRR